jgi:prevent-host-death family protein
MTSLEERTVGKMVGIAEFKAKCSEFLRELETGGGPITITNRGKVVGVLNPPPAPERKPCASSFGMMKGTVTHAPDFELDQPVDPNWEAEWEAKWDRLGFPVLSSSSK